MNYFWLLIAAWVGFMLGLVTCALFTGPRIAALRESNAAMFDALLRVNGEIDKVIADLERGAR